MNWGWASWANKNSVERQQARTRFEKQREAASRVQGCRCCLPSREDCERLGYPDGCYYGDRI
jgi:hypothetical protein